MSAILTSPGEIEALISLLDDPEKEVQEAVGNRLSELGRVVLPDLRKAMVMSENVARERIAHLIHELHFSDIKRSWNALMEKPNADLEKGVFLLALHRFPNLNLRGYNERLNRMAEDIRPKVEAAQGVGRAFVLSNYLCNTLGFQGNNENYTDPNNSYINCVLESKKGIPVSLSVIFLLLGKRLGLPVYGVNMPAHFLVKYKDHRHEVFYDIFNGGNPLMREQCKEFLLKAGIKPRPNYFRAANGQTILLRMICNLLAVASGKNQTRFQAELSHLMEPWRTDPKVP